MPDHRPLLHVEWQAHLGGTWVAHLKVANRGESSLCGGVPASGLRKLGYVTPSPRPMAECDICKWRLVRLTKEFNVVLHSKAKGKPTLILKE